MRAAQFRAMRETLGLSQEDVGDAVGVDCGSVESWEAGVNPISDDVEEWLSCEKAVADYAVNSAIGNILALPDPPATVSLAYYRTQEEYDQFGRGDGPFHIGNANARRVADALEAEGIDCEFYYPGESEAVETCSPHMWG